MNEGSLFIEILIFAMVAGFILLRLHRVLGRRTGHERPPPEPVPDAQDDSGETVIRLPERDTERKPAAADSAPESVSGLTQLKIADPGFSEDSFLEGARAAFEMIVNSFAKGDKQQLRGLLSNEVYRQFATAIDDREAAGEQLETTLVSIILADLVDVAMNGRTAEVTVKFISEQVNVTRKTDGTVVDGDATHVASVTDIWTFARDTRSRDPNWALVGTRSAD